MENVIEDFETSDLVLASTLATLNYPMKSLKPTGERFIFIFAGDDSISDVVSQFTKDKLLVEPKRFSYYYRHIKRKLFDTMQQKGDIPYG